MVEDFDIKVPIRGILKKCLIFGLHARPPIGYILSYLGYQHEVMPILQILSHSTRAFIFNADGLPGFVQRFEISEILLDADNQNQLEFAKKWQEIDLVKVKVELEKIKSKQRLTYLIQHYPSLSSFILMRLDRCNRLDERRLECKGYINHHNQNKYTQYIHNYLIPWFDQQRAEKKITEGE